MKKILLIASLFTLTLNAFAQNTGHPGGGGPDTTVSDRDVACATLDGLTEELEEKFVKSWNKEFNSSKVFYKLMNHIIVENVIHTLAQVDTISTKQLENCSDDKKHLSEINLPSRPHYKEELALLKQIQENWRLINKGIAGSRKCSEAFIQRREHQQELEALIRLYEKQAP